MRAVLFDEFGGPLRVDTVADPAPERHGVVVQVEAAGLCRSDWHGWVGHDPDIPSLPHVPGHELAGTVVAVGADVVRWREGDRVTVPFTNACGTCATCAEGWHQICDNQRQPGFTHWGAFAELVRLDWADVNLVALPRDMDFAAAASLGCRFATAWRAVLQVGRVQAGEWVAVHGCGGVGLSAIMIAVAAGARVVAVDVAPSALAMARELGAEVVVEAGGDAGDAAAALREATGGGAHLSLDAIGHPAAVTASVNGLRKHGRHVQIGLLPEPAAVPMDVVIVRELSVLGSHGLAAHAYPAMLDLVATGRLDPARLITRRIGLDAVPEALAAMSTSSPTGVTVIAP
jgi:D-arabinose 1-dehydrogenase-like Zn-dependent alcohol dehydrogenase